MHPPTSLPFPPPPPPPSQITIVKNCELKEPVCEVQDHGNRPGNIGRKAILFPVATRDTAANAAYIPEKPCPPPIRPQR